MILQAKTDISKVSLIPGVDAFSAVGLSKLKKCLKFRNAELFIISENQENNVKALTNILASQINEIQAKIYCHARRDDFNSRIEFSSKTDIRFVDSSRLAIQNLIKNHTELHPVNFVDIKHDTSIKEVVINDKIIQLPQGLKMGYVTSSFNAMIVGFGEMGQEALSYLYEFGAFSNGNGGRSEFSCWVIDKDMDMIEGDFRLKCPAKKCNSMIHCEKDNPQSLSFWENMENRIQGLNYILVSLGDDRMNMSVGLKNLEFAKKKRENLKNFIVLVRNYNYDIESERIEKIYNSNFSEDGRTVFKCIAKKHDIWKYSVISNSLLYDEASVYHSNYIKTADDGWGGLDWDSLNNERHTILHTTNITDTLRKTPKKMPLFMAMGDDRMIMQDYLNVLHAHTKKTLCDTEIFSKKSILDRIPIVKGYPDEDDSKPHFIIPEGISGHELEQEIKFSQVLTNLADTEHIRWNASHEIRGCEWGEKKDEITRRFPYMVECRDLKSGLVIHYDWIVVKQSLKM